MAEPAMPVLLGLSFAATGLATGLATLSPSAAAVLACVNGSVAACLAFFTSPEQLLVELAASLAVACIWHRRRAPH